MYELDDIHRSFGTQFTKLNSENVKRVNRLGKERIDYKKAVLFGGSPFEIKVAFENIINLKKQIMKLHATVESLGGVYYKIPDRFNDVHEK